MDKIDGKTVFKKSGGALGEPEYISEQLVQAVYVLKHTSQWKLHAEVPAS